MAVSLLIMRMRSPEKRLGHWEISTGMEFEFAQVPTTELLARNQQHVPHAQVAPITHA